MTYQTINTKGLERSQLHNDPLKQFSLWWQDAVQFKEQVIDAAALATCGKDLWPTVRMVLIKKITDHSVIFFTNYESKKALQLLENPKASLAVFWPGMERQVRITGTTSKTSREISEEYFHSRPRGSQISAFTSNQSSIIESRAELEKKYNDTNETYKNQQIPLPEYWGGFELTPVSFEFWQGRQDRLHDRFLYTKRDDAWTVARLAP